MKQVFVLFIILLLLSTISYSATYIIEEKNPGYDGYLLQQKKSERNKFLYKIESENEERLRLEKKEKKNWLRIIRGNAIYGYNEELDKPEHYSILFRYWNDDSLEDHTSAKYKWRE